MLHEQVPPGHRLESIATASRCYPGPLSALKSRRAVWAISRLLPWLLLPLLSLSGGCREPPSATPPAPSERAPSERAPSERAPSERAPSERAGDEPRRGAAPGATSAGATLSAAPRPSHPIDQLPEGRLYRQATAALDEGDRATAERLRRQLADHPQYAVLADALAAIALAKEGEAEAALTAAQQISTVPVMRAEAFMIAGEALRVQGRWGEAIAAFQNALEAHPDHLRAHRWLGALYHDTGAMQLATHHLRTVALLDPADHRSLRLAGLIHREYENYEEAVLDYQQALERAPPEHMALEIRLELAESLLQLRRLSDALAVLDPLADSTEALAPRAAILEALGEVEEATALARRAHVQQPDDPRTNLLLGRLHHSQQQWHEAIEHLQLAVEAKPTDHEPRFLLGRALLNAGHTEEGREQMERATELRDTFLELAELHLEAVERPSDAAVRFQLGQLAERLHLQRIALSWYRAALGLDPKHTEAAEALERLGETAPTR